MEGAKPSTATPMNLVHAIPTKTDVPIVYIASLTLSHLFPSHNLNLIIIWATNSTANPIQVTKFTTLTALISIYIIIFTINTTKPPNITFVSHIVPIKLKAIKNTNITTNTPHITSYTKVMVVKIVAKANNTLVMATALIYEY